MLIERDITKRKQIEADLKRAINESHHSKAFVTNILKSSVDAVIAADTSGRLVIFNQAAGEITGYSEDEALNQLNIRQIYPKGGARRIMKLLRAEKPDGKGKLKAHQVMVLHKDGGEIPISLSASIVEVNQRPVGSVGFFYDLREKMKMERELDQTRGAALAGRKNGLHRQTGRRGGPPAQQPLKRHHPVRPYHAGGLRPE